MNDTPIYHGILLSDLIACEFNSDSDIWNFLHDLSNSHFGYAIDSHHVEVMTLKLINQSKNARIKSRFECKTNLNWIDYINAMKIIHDYSVRFNGLIIFKNEMNEADAAATLNHLAKFKKNLEMLKKR